MGEIWFAPGDVYGGADRHQRHFVGDYPDPDVRRGRPEVLDAQAGGLDPGLLAGGHVPGG